MESSKTPCIICFSPVQDNFKRLKQLNIEDEEEVENDKIFQWFLLKFKFPRKKYGKKNAIVERYDQLFRNKSIGWDGQGGKSSPLPFCAECKAKLVGLMEEMSVDATRKRKLAAPEGFLEIKRKMSECEAEFEACGIYDKDKRYHRVRNYIMKLRMSPIDKQMKQSKSKRLSVEEKQFKDELDMKEEDDEDWPWENHTTTKVKIEKDLEEEDNEEDVKEDFSGSSKRSLQKGNEFNHNCLLCYAVISKKENDQAPVLTNDILEQNLNSVFILRKMLGVPRETLASYLEKIGDPGKWVEYCKSCLGLVDGALRIQKEISELEYKLRTFQNKMKAKIKSTFLIKNTMSENGGIIRITEESRQFIAKMGTKVDLGISTNENEDDGLEEPLQPWSPSDDLDQGSDVEDKMPQKHPAKKPKITVNEELEENSEQKFNNYLKEGSYICSLCPPSFNGTMSLAEFHSHLIFHAQRPYKCSICNLYWSGHKELEKNPFANESPLDSHLCSGSTLVKTPEEKYPGKIWECEWCPNKFELEMERNSHEEREHPILKSQLKMEYKCLSCDSTVAYRSFREWLLHRSLEHPEVVASHCLYCDYRAATQLNGISSGGDHDLTNSAHPPSCASKNLFTAPEICDFCGVPCEASTGEMSHHLKTVHKLTSESSIYSCHYCWSRFGQLTELNAHKKLEHSFTSRRRKKKAKVICDICGRLIECAKSKYHITNHKLMKHGIEPDDLTGPKILACNKSQECGGFRTLFSWIMRDHMARKHGAERKWKCDQCGKRFVDSTKLRTHQQIHANKELKPFQCEICGNSFAVKNYLYIHMRLSHQNRPFASTNKKRRRKVAGANGGESSNQT